MQDELFFIDISTDESIEQSIYNIGKLLEEYTNCKEHETLDKYDDKKFKYEKFGIDVNDDYFHFELVKRQYYFNRSIVWGLYKLVGTTFINFDENRIVQEFNELQNKLIKEKFIKK